MANPTPCSACRAPMRNPRPPTPAALLTEAWEFLTEANRVQRHPKDITADLSLQHADRRFFAWR